MLKRKILFAPSHRSAPLFFKMLDDNGITAIELSEKFLDSGFELIFRPHPINYEDLLKSGLEIPFQIDMSDDIHDSLSTYAVVISDFSGLLIDCWELELKHKNSHFLLEP